MRLMCIWNVGIALFSVVQPNLQAKSALNELSENESNK